MIPKMTNKILHNYGGLSILDMWSWGPPLNKLICDLDLFADICMMKYHANSAKIKDDYITPKGWPSGQNMVSSSSGTRGLGINPRFITLYEPKGLV